ncbi:MAG: hydrogenase maturation nickel metallochaperone HypA [Pseudomonadota bacterium]
MHELSVCMALLEQVQKIARQHKATRVERIELRIGPLSGVEASLLERAYPLAASGTLAEDAQLVIESMSIKVRCSQCGAESEVLLNRLICSACGDFRTRVISGDEMLLSRVVLATAKKERQH